jgi:Tol biopolymer transport system component
MLRKALGDALAEPIYIETVPKRGYRFVAPVTMCIEGPEPDAPAWRRGNGVRWAAAIAATGIAIVAVGAMLATGGRLAGRRSTEATTATHAQVTFSGTASAPAISQDGQRFAYISGDAPDKRAFVRDLSGGRAIEIIHAPELGYLRWSPDDHQLLVWARGGGKAGVYVVSANGGAPRQIAGRRFLACWSPDGSVIGVPHFLGGEISLRNTQGVEQRKLSLDGGPHWSIWDLDWSRAAGRLAVVSNDYEGRYTIWTIQPDGTDQRKVLEEKGEITTVRWSPDGTALYYSHRQHQTVTIKRVLLRSIGEGSDQPAAVLTGLEAGRAFSISADGTRVLYARAPFHSNLWGIDLDRRTGAGGPLTRPLTEGTAYIERPRISPDGTRVIFNVGHEPQTQLYTMPVSGGPWTQLVDLKSTNVGAAWSPDGKQIAFASLEGQKPQVWTVEAAGGIPRRRSTRAISDSFDLSWSPSGIAYQSPGNRNYTILNPDTGDERPLLDHGEDGWIFSPVANAMGQMAVFWQRAERGIWMIEPGSRQHRLLYPTKAGSAYPIGWSPGNDAVLVVEGEPAELREMPSRLGETMKDATVLKVPVAGGVPQVLARIPFAEIGAVAMTPDGRTLVLPVFSSSSDVWLVDHFSASGGHR